VTNDPNPWLFELLNEFEALAGLAAILNTSFHSKGSSNGEQRHGRTRCAGITDLDDSIIDSWVFSKHRGQTLNVQA
jgi:predicted NodU family carbamoyl transferase